MNTGLVTSICAVCSLISVIITRNYFAFIYWRSFNRSLPPQQYAGLVLFIVSSTEMFYSAFITSRFILCLVVVVIFIQCAQMPVYWTNEKVYSNSLMATLNARHRISKCGRKRLCRYPLAGYRVRWDNGGFQGKSLQPSTLGLDDNKICSSPTISPSRLITTHEFTRDQHSSDPEVRVRLVYCLLQVFKMLWIQLSASITKFTWRVWQCGGVLAASYSGNKNMFLYGLLHCIQNWVWTNDHNCLSVSMASVEQLGVQDDTIYAIQVIQSIQV